jgi:hypothetical protein
VLRTSTAATGSPARSWPSSSRRSRIAVSGVRIWWETSARKARSLPTSSSIRSAIASKLAASWRTSSGPPTARARVDSSPSPSVAAARSRRRSGRLTQRASSTDIASATRLASPAPPNSRIQRFRIDTPVSWSDRASTKIDIRPVPPVTGVSTTTRWPFEADGASTSRLLQAMRSCAAVSGMGLPWARVSLPVGS